MARLEWLIERSMQADDDSNTGIINADEIEAYDPEDIYTVVNNSLQLMATDYPVFELWQAHRESRDVSSVQGLDDRDYLCICRDEHDDVIIRSISDELFNFLLAAINSVSLYSLLSADTAKMLPLLQQAIHEKWIIGFRI